MSDIAFANTMAELSLGITAASIMTECEKYGMCYGCNDECPVLIAGKCELQDDECKELYKEAMGIRAVGI